MRVLMRPLWEVMSGQRRHPLAHLLLHKQHLHRCETCKGLGLKKNQSRFTPATHLTRSLAHLRGAAVAQGLLGEAAAALDVLLPLEER